MGIVPAIRREKNMNAEFFPLFIGTHDKTVLQLIQMLLSGILMGLKCNQNTHKKSRKCFQLPFWFPIYFYSWNEEGTWKSILDLIKNAPRCKRQKRTISTDCIILLTMLEKKCMVHNWPFDLFDTTETNSFPHSIKTNMDSFLSIYRDPGLESHFWAHCVRWIKYTSWIGKYVTTIMWIEYKFSNLWEQSTLYS